MKKYLSQLSAIALSALMLSGCAEFVPVGAAADSFTDSGFSTVAETAAAVFSQTEGTETERYEISTAIAEPAALRSSKKEQTKTTAAKPVVKLPVQPEQVINETPATYAKFGINKNLKKAFQTKASQNVKLPIINVTTNNEDIVSREEYVSCVVDVFNCEKSQIIDEASAGIKVRGNSSAYYGDVEEILKNQVPYRIKFDSKTNMLGLNNGAKCKSWVLLKSDWDLIRNDIALRLGRAIIGDNAFCSDARFVHLYVNDEFKGIYLLCEQSQVNSKRVDITEPEKGYTGVDIGYYLEIDNYAWSEPDNHFFIVDYGGYEIKDI